MKRRDFLVASASTLGATLSGPAHANSWSDRFPNTTVLNVSVGGMIPGQQVMLATKDGPITIRYRTQKEIIAARAIPMSDLKDPYAQNANLPHDSPATDQNRTLDADGKWFVFRPNCTHLGMIVLEAAEPVGTSLTWISCPSHGGRYDSAGRVLAGPAPTNLAIPLARFVTDDIIEVHSNANGALQKQIREAHPSTW